LCGNWSVCLPNGAVAALRAPRGLAPASAANPAPATKQQESRIRESGSDSFFGEAESPLSPRDVNRNPAGSSRLTLNFEGTTATGPILSGIPLVAAKQVEIKFDFAGPNAAITHAYSLAGGGTTA